MQHFLSKIVGSKGSDLSKDPSVHYRFVRYSKGIFNGPALKLTKRGKSITIKGSPDYEDICGFFVASSITSDDILVNGNVLCFEDPKALVESTIPPGKMAQLNIVKKKTNYLMEVTGTWNQDDLLKIYSAFQGLRGYILLKISLEGDKSISFTVKTKPPKNTGEYDLEKVVKFCSAKIPSNEEMVTMVIDELLPDFKDKISKFKSITIENKYEIKDITIPPDAKGNKRLAAIRSGTITRNVDIDEQKSSTTVDFTA
ncbi:MAG: hypothetical protein ACFFCS_09080 [Candidatus Hodarchaeota archaeon]